MTGTEYQFLAARTINTKLKNKELERHALHGMVGEIGELHSIYQKVYQGHIEKDNTHKLKELGDLMCFIAEYCTALDVDLSYVMKMNIEKLQARYPEGFKSSDSINRKEGDI